MMMIVSKKTKRGGDQETEIRTDDVPGSSNTFYNLPTPADTHLNFLQISSGHNHVSKHEVLATVRIRITLNRIIDPSSLNFDSELLCPQRLNGLMIFSSPAISFAAPLVLSLNGPSFIMIMDTFTIHWHHGDFE